MNNTTTNSQDNDSGTESVVSHLRRLMPTRQIRVFEARRIAELQAYRLRMLLGDESPSFDMDRLTALPRIDVSLATDLNASGSTHWQAGAWRVQLNQSEALVRQRFTLAHEFKHVLDAPQLETAYRSISEQIDGEAQIEAICDYFAACLLMPKRWVKRLWGEGIRELEPLADVFEVSQVAMKRRLEDLAIIDRPRRSYRPTASRRIEPDWFRTAGLPNRPRFHRARPRSDLQKVST